MKKALIVGVQNYQYPFEPLEGSIGDARNMHEVLSQHQDGTLNFACLKLYAQVTRKLLWQKIKELFVDEVDVALLYFSGHGQASGYGGFLITEDCEQLEDGIPMEYILKLANHSKTKEVVIILDCCNSGAILDSDIPLREGVCVMTASRSKQPAVENKPLEAGEASGGLFTKLLCDALNGGAADVLGKVSVASVYAYIDEALGGWQQRPMFKANLSRLILLRQCKPQIDHSTMKLLVEYFPIPDFVYPLDSSYEPEAEPEDAEHERIFKHFQKFRDARLLIPVGAEHLYFAAIENKSCKLTALGQYYWQLAKEGKL